MAPQAFGDWLADARVKKAWSQERLAAETLGKVSVKTISALEQGRILDPRLSTVQELQRALGNSFFPEPQRYNAESEQVPA